MIEAAFHVARRDVAGLDPIPYSPCPDESPAQPIGYQLAPEHEPIAYALVDEPTA